MMYRHKINTDTVLDSFEKGTCKNGSNILENFPPRGTNFLKNSNLAWVVGFGDF